MVQDTSGRGEATMDTWSVITIITFLFVLLVSLWHIHLHFTHWREPVMQSLYVRIIMLPIAYSFTGMMVVIFGVYATLFDFLRDGFEAYGLFCFVVMVFVYIKGEKKLALFMNDNPSSLKHMGLCCKVCCPPFKDGFVFVKFIRMAMLQFVFCKPLLALALSVLEIKEHETPHSNHQKTHTLEKGLVLVQIFTAVVVTVALYALFNLYKVTKTLLVGLSPLAKFLSIKALVALTILQRLVLTGMVSRHIIKGTATATAEERSLRLENFLISIEMVFFTVLFFFVFAYNEFRMKSSSSSPSAATTTSWCGKLAHSCSFCDIVNSRVDTMIKTSEMVQLTTGKDSNGESSTGSAGSAGGETTTTTTTTTEAGVTTATDAA